MNGDDSIKLEVWKKKLPFVGVISSSELCFVNTFYCSVLSMKENLRK